METITNSLAIRPPTYEYRVRGTIAPKNEDDILELYLVNDETGEEITPIEIKYGTFFANCEDSRVDNEVGYSMNLYVNGEFEDNIAAGEVINNSVYSFEAYGHRTQYLDYAEIYVGKRKIYQILLSGYTKRQQCH